MFKTKLTVLVAAFLLVNSGAHAKLDHNAKQEHKYEGQVLDSRYFKQGSPSGLNLAEIYRVFLSNKNTRHDSPQTPDEKFVYAVIHIAQINENMQEIIGKLKNEKNEEAKKATLARAKLVSEAKKKYIRIAEESGLTDEEIANIGTPEKMLLGSQDPTGLYLPLVKADAGYRRQQGENNPFSYKVVGYGDRENKLKSIREAAKGNQGQKEALNSKLKLVIPVEEQIRLTELTFEDIRNKLKALGLTDAQISAIPPSDDPRWDEFNVDELTL